ncbi:MAG: hypothetical protein Q9160_006612 [Pyrenula sp. 1 TL-2023]
MPGILPMKVIRVGSNSQSRIAQACDRCRSKKIRCDGVRPCCSQCKNVGFECKTSDKLSRRAFPRGYTESLEDRVRALEAENRELKDLLDEKDEKIDMLSKIHSFSPASRKNSSALTPVSTNESIEESPGLVGEIAEVSPLSPGDTNAAIAGLSSTATFLESFKLKAQSSGKPEVNVQISRILPPLQPPTPSRSSTGSGTNVPPRILSDQYVNIFFQEWAPLLPILHRPTFLRTYEEYIADPESIQWSKNKHAIAQLYFIFGISAQSSMARGKQCPSYESQWRKAMQTISSEVSLAALQCHVLAQIFFLVKGDHKRLARYRATATSICHQLGLHQSQKYYSVDLMECELRKRAFWAQYVLDRLSAATLGQPVMMRESDITTEYPTDIDDENLTDKGFLPALPGEPTKISNALALIHVSRILSSALEQLYPAAASYSVSVDKARVLDAELDEWSKALPSHLRLQFSNDKPSTNVISDRSPLLILDLLDERKMNFTFPMNKGEMLITSGFVLLWQKFDLPSDGKIMQDTQKSMLLLLDVFKRYSAEGAINFASIVQDLTTRQISPESDLVRKPTLPSPDIRSLASMTAPPVKHKSARKQFQAIASRFTSFASKNQLKQPNEATPRRSVVTLAPAQTSTPLSSLYGRTYSQLSVSSAQSEPTVPVPPGYISPTVSHSSQSTSSGVNLDYFPMAHQSSVTLSPSALRKDNGMLSDSNWTEILASMDSGNANIFNGIYGGNLDGEIPDFAQFPASCQGTDPVFASTQDWPQEVWPADAINMLQNNRAPVPQSLNSFSDDSLTSSGEEFSGTGSSKGSSLPPQEAFNEVLGEGTNVGGIAIPHFDFDDFDCRYQ